MPTMRGRSRSTYWGAVLDAPDPVALAHFYAALLEWPIIEVFDLAAAVEHAVELGATVADFQPQDDVRVLLDPVGPPSASTWATSQAATSSPCRSAERPLRRPARLVPRTRSALHREREPARCRRRP